MEIVLEKLLPILLFFIIGYVLQITKVLKREDALIFLKLIFYLLSPCVIILSVSQMNITENLLYYPIAAICIHICMYIIGLLVIKFQKLNEDEVKIFRGSALIMNMTFILPFFIMFFGEKNVYMLSIFDTGNLLMITTIVYSIFVSKKDSNLLDKLITILKSPSVIALIIGFVFNLLNIRLPKSLGFAMQELAKITGTLIMLALGLYFTPKFSKLGLSLKIIMTKVIGILIVGTVIGHILPLDSMGRTLILLGALSPVGNNILTYTFIGGGDMELATNVVSLSIIISFINVSILFFILH